MGVGYEFSFLECITYTMELAGIGIEDCLEDKAIKDYQKMEKHIFPSFA